MFPGLSLNDVVYCGLNDPKLQSQPRVHFSSVVSFSDFCNLLIREFVPDMGFSRTHSVKPSLINSILIILRCCAEPKMVRSDAGCVVPIWAIVKNTLSFRNHSEVNQPRCSMGQHRSCSWNSRVNPPVSFRVLRSGPYPTGIIAFKFFNVLPESFTKGGSDELTAYNYSANSFLNIKHWLMCHAPGIARCAGAFFELYRNLRRRQL